MLYFTVLDSTCDVIWTCVTLVAFVLTELSIVYIEKYWERDRGTVDLVKISGLMYNNLHRFHLMHNLHNFSVHDLHNPCAHFHLCYSTNINTPATKFSSEKSWYVYGKSRTHFHGHYHCCIYSDLWSRAQWNQICCLLCVCGQDILSWVWRVFSAFCFYPGGGEKI